MYALIPCPAELLEDVKNNVRGSDRYEGFWLLSQDPSLIAQAGDNAVSAPSVAGLVDLVDRKFKLPFGYSKLRKHDIHCWAWQKRERSIYGGPVDAITIAKQVFASKCEHAKDRDDQWTVYTLLPGPAVTQGDLHEMDILAEAKCHKNGIYTERFKLKGTRKVEVLKDDFVVESTPLGTRVIYSPKRAKRLLSVRSRHSTVGQRRARRTCFELLKKTVIVLRETYRCEALDGLYNERWSCSGIREFSRAIVNFFDMARRMGKLHTARRVIAPLVRELWIHRRLIQKNCVAEFRLWYEKELKVAGGPPKDPERYMTRIKVREEVQKDSA